jgi:hypothetical protein
MKKVARTPWPLHAMATRLNVPAKWLREEAKEGRIPHLDAGGVLLFDPETVERIVMDRLREAARRDAANG